MHLTRLEVQGFKTFAKKTIVNLSGPKNDRHALTVIVGPNGSGKSNLADAMRWCLGEQSMKALRGKKADDIIFSGAQGKTRSGFAEVTMTFDNSDKTLDIAYSEITVTRRFYRDGDSEYILNGKQARLSDIQLLLAEAGIGQRSYTVIGQGMIDHVLTASPEERKIFFDDATGVRGLQIKRHQALLKLQKSTENLVEAEMLLSEIEPRLKILRRQIRRLEKRETIEAEVRQIQTNYYGTLWWNYQAEMEEVLKQLTKIESQIKTRQDELASGDAELSAMEKTMGAGAQDEARRAAQEKYRSAQNALHNAQQKVFELERDIEMSKIKAQSAWSPLPLVEIVKQLDDILRMETTDGVAKIVKMIRTLRERLTRPKPEAFKVDVKAQKGLEDARDQVKLSQDEIKTIEREIDNLSKAQTKPKTDVFAVQRKLRDIQSDLHALESQANRINIDKARIETRRESLDTEMKEEIPALVDQIKAQAPAKRERDLEESRAQMLRLKHQLELIGSIDDETMAEYKDTDERFSFLTGQTTDLRGAINSTEQIIDELDERIRSQSAKAFKNINDEFQKYFKILFGGGSCSLIKLKETEMLQEDTKVALDRALEELAEDKIESDQGTASEAVSRFKKRRDTVAGIDIQATPPGKKLKALNLLSGGERALTSIALISAIMATNPSPFVVLDEVDAALDEANTVRFANILDQLRKLTQFVVITHNRATMERADLLYGVTMGDDGVSSLLSVSLTDIAETGTARR